MKILNDRIHKIYYEEHLNSLFVKFRSKRYYQISKFYWIVLLYKTKIREKTNKGD